MAGNSMDSGIANLMRRLVRGQQPEESGGSVFNITVENLQELIDMALHSDRNKTEIFNMDALKPLTTALHERYGNEINSLAADLIGLLAEGDDHQARCCAIYSHEGIGVKEKLIQRSRSKDMRVRTSARAALYSMMHNTITENTLTTQPNQVALIEQPITSLRTENYVPNRELARSITPRNTFEGDVADSIFRSLSHELGSEWQSLATQLKVPYQSVAKLQSDTPRNTTQQCFEMFRTHWFNIHCSGLNDQQIKSRLKQALQHRTVGRNDLADKLEFIMAEAMHQIGN